MKQNFNGWTNWETWNFMLWYGDTLNDLINDQKEEMGHLKHDEFYRWLYDTVHSFIIEMKEEYQLKSGFISDVIDHAFSQINIIEIVDDINENL